MIPRETTTTLWLLGTLLCIASVLLFFTVTTLVASKGVYPSRNDFWHSAEQLCCSLMLTLTGRGGLYGFVFVFFGAPSLIAIRKKARWKALFLVFCLVLCLAGIPIPFAASHGILRILQLLLGLAAMPVAAQMWATWHNTILKGSFVKAILVCVWLYFPVADVVLATGWLGNSCDSD
jgi:hypothetical protein